MIMDWKEFIKPNKRKIILTIIIVIIVFYLFIIAFSCRLSDMRSRPPETVCQIATLISSPIFGSINISADINGSSFIPIGTVVGFFVSIILSYGLALVLTFTISKIKNFNEK